MQKIFEALASAPRRRILGYLAHSELSAGEIASRFNISKSAVSQHLAVLQTAELVESQRRGHFVYYRSMPDNLINALTSFIRDLGPVD